MERYDVGIWLNVLLIILECIALIQCLDALGCIDLTFYTIDSNIFLLISAVLYLISRKNIPYIVHLAKYSSTVSVLITLLVVLFALYPLSNFDFQFMFLSGPNLLMHVLCPIIALISFLLFGENSLENTLKNNLRALYFTVIYALILISLNILKIVVGPYPFLKVYEQSVFVSVFWILGIFIGAFILARLLLMIKELNFILHG